MSHVHNVECCQYLNVTIKSLYTVLILVGVYLSLKRMLYYTNAIIPITNIGETNTSMVSVENNAIQCITDKSSCCEDNIGEWYYPSEERVEVFDLSFNNSIIFYLNRGPNDGTVNLNRHKSNINLTSLIGEFCCVIPDVTNFNRKICAIMGKQLIS